jgi:hypothetical protein
MSKPLLHQHPSPPLCPETPMVTQKDVHGPAKHMPATPRSTVDNQAGHTRRLPAQVLSRPAGTTAAYVLAHEGAPAACFTTPHVAMPFAVTPAAQLASSLSSLSAFLPPHQQRVKTGHESHPSGSAAAMAAVGGWRTWWCWPPVSLLPLPLCIHMRCCACTTSSTRLRLWAAVAS